MANRIEIEKKYFCNELDKLKVLLKNENFKTHKAIIENDEYFTDIDSKYIKNRTCLRIRKTDTKYMELTFKGKSNVLNNIYAKKESDISIDINEYNDVVELLSALGYYSYVEVKKVRHIYTKKEVELTYNVMIDEIENVGQFIEFEILCNDENKSIEILKNKLKEFVNKFRELNLQEADLPYRDFVASIIFNNLTNSKEKTHFLLDLDGTLINSEKEFFECFRDTIYEQFKYEITIEEYIENEQNQNNNLINYLKNKNIIHENIDEQDIMKVVYEKYRGKFVAICDKKESVINFELLKKIKNLGVKLALVTTCKRIYIDILKETLKIEGLFEVIIAKEDVNELKPNKEAYKKAIDILNVNKQNCLIIEDSKRGYIAAKNIEIDCVLVSEFALNKEIEKNINCLKNFTQFSLIFLNNI